MKRYRCRNWESSQYGSRTSRSASRDHVMSFFRDFKQLKDLFSQPENAQNKTFLKYFWSQQVDVRSNTVLDQASFFWPKRHSVVSYWAKQWTENHLVHRSSKLTARQVRAGRTFLFQRYCFARLGRISLRSLHSWSHNWQNHSSLQLASS